MAEGEILIAGAGALGSVLGGLLRAAGHEVTLLGRRRHLDAIARDGLRVSGIFGEHHAMGFALTNDIAKLDRRFSIVLVTVKTYDTLSLSRALTDYVTTDGVVVSLQNGLGNIEALIAHLRAERLLGGRVIFGAEITAPGHVRVTVIAEPVAIGPAPALHGAASAKMMDRAKDIASMLSSAGVPCEAVPDIMPVLWSKVLYNVALNPLGAILKTHYGALGEDPELRMIMNRTVTEAFALATRLGIAMPFKDAAEYLNHFYTRLLPPTFDHRPTMLYDLENRGRTEIDALNGMVVKLADELGLEAITNRTLTALIHASERLRKSIATKPQ